MALHIKTKYPTNVPIYSAIDVFVLIICINYHFMAFKYVFQMVIQFSKSFYFNLLDMSYFIKSKMHQNMCKGIFKFIFRII